MTTALAGSRANALEPIDRSSAPIGLFSGTNCGTAKLRVRRLSNMDLPAVEQHLLSLSPADRRSRFLAEVSDATVIEYVRQLESSDVALLGAFGPSGRLFGLVEGHGAGNSAAIEVSVSVDLAHRRQGLGRRLVMCLLANTFAHGARSAEFLFDPSNAALYRLVRGLGGRSGSEPGYACIRHVPNVLTALAA
jgi:ribosomal protein S18 acetylase RimI-like enzyme